MAPLALRPQTHPVRCRRREAPSRAGDWGGPYRYSLPVHRFLKTEPLTSHQASPVTRALSSLRRICGTCGRPSPADEPPWLVRSAQPLTVKLTSRVSVLLLTLSVTLISSRYSPSGKLVSGISSVSGTGYFEVSKVGGTS